MLSVGGKAAEPDFSKRDINSVTEYSLSARIDLPLLHFQCELLFPEKSSVVDL